MNTVESATVHPATPVDRQPRRLRSRLGLVLWLLVLVVGIVVFHRLGSGALAAPPIRPGDWGAWAQGRDPLVTTMALLRMLVLVLAWYLLVASSIGVVARLARSARMIAAADAVTVPALRRFLRTTLGATLATAIITTAPVATGQTGRAHAAPPIGMAEVITEPRADPLPDDTARLPGAFLPLPLELVSDRDSADPAAADAGRGAADVTEAIGQDADSALADASPTDAVREPPDDTEVEEVIVLDAIDDTDSDEVVTTDLAHDADPTARGPADHGKDAVTVEPGESLWSIARDALARGSRSEPDDAQVAVYWAQVIERNRPTLPDPSNPDLIFPGDVVILPQLPDRLESGR